MKKKIFTLLFALVAVLTAQAQVVLNTANFPDANFRAALASQLGINEGDEITAEKIAATTSLDVSFKSIAELTGIEHFTALTVLWCYNNQLTSLDVSKNTALTDLSCDYNRLTSLDVSQNTALTYLGCGNNQLTSLDVSKNTALTYLRCGYNRLASLDVSQNTALNELSCSGNQLTSLNVSQNTTLKKFWCEYNQLTSLDVSKNTALTTLYCYYNQLTSLDVSKNITLEELYCGSNRLTSLDVSKNTVLTELYCWSNRLTSLDVSKNTALTELSCSGNLLTSLDVSKNTALESLSCINNLLTSLDVSKNTALESLSCINNLLTSLDVSKNTALRWLYCYSNQIKGKEMDALVNSLPTVVSGKFTVIDTKDENEGNVCTKSQVAIAKEKGWTVYDYNGGVYDENYEYPEYEGCDDVAEKLLLNAENFPDANFRAALAEILGISEGDEITAEKIAATTSLFVGGYGKSDSEKIADLTGIEHFNALTRLSCEYNQLTSIDVSKNTALTYFSCINNLLTSLDVSQNAALSDLRCGKNQLTSLNVSGCTALKLLFCYSNPLTSLDVSQNTALEGLFCYDNHLTTLDVSGCTALTTLDCYSNQLTTLNVSGCAALTELLCYNNQLTSLDVSKNTALTNLQCQNNLLTTLDVSKNTALTLLGCFNNQIKGKAMDALVGSLPTVENGRFYVINTKDENEGNVCTKSQVAIAKEKGWTVYDLNGSSSNKQEYEGSDDPEEDIDPVDEGDSVDFGNDMDENTNLNGNVIGNIFYNIGDSDGKYDSAEGCIVVKKPMSDSDVSNLEGKDIFGEDFKNNFTGIVFKVPAGKGVVKVDAETMGNMLLKVKIGSSDPVEMELNGKLKVKFPYNVSEPTLVYIYAGVASEAKGFGAPASGESALKIYGIEFTGDDTPTGIDNSQFTIGNSADAWYSIDGKKLNGEPTRKGVYIHKGKKVVK